MEITWLGHACIRVRTGNTTLLMDPPPAGSGLNLTGEQANASAITISGGDAETNANSSVRITDPGEYEAAGLHIKGIRNTRRDPSSEEKLWNTMYLVESEGMTICHLGDPADALQTKELDELGSPHVMFVPAGSPNGMGVADLTALINALEPRIVIPVLYAHPGNKESLRELQPFIQELGSQPSQGQARLTITRANLPEDMQIALLQPLL